MLSLHDLRQPVNGNLIDRFLNSHHRAVPIMPPAPDDGVLPGQYRAQVAAIEIVDRVLKLRWRVLDGRFAGHVVPQKMSIATKAGQRKITSLCVALDDAMILLNINLAIGCCALVTVSDGAVVKVKSLMGAVR
jgi:hypothetical protein